MKASILIVEDEAITALDLKHQLTSMDYEVVGITDTAEEALRFARERRPRLVLMDIRLSGDLDGIVAASAIRGEAGLPVVFLTAHSDQATLDRALAASPFGYLLKPFQARELRVAVEVALYKHAREREMHELQVALHEAVIRETDPNCLLPICAGCKRVRDGSNQWIEIEEYIRRVSRVRLTHGVCPACVEQNCPELTAPSG